MYQRRADYRLVYLEFQLKDIQLARSANLTPESFMVTTCAVYKMNSTGPSTDPWDTPQVELLREDRLSPTLTEKVLLWR